MRIHHLNLGAGGMLALLFAGGAMAWEPGAQDAIGNAAQPLMVDTTDRNDVVSFYNCMFMASEDYAEHTDWTGSVSGCSAGTTSDAFRHDVRRRVNYFRAMAGVPADIEFSSSFNSDAQAAALIMAARGQLSHTPPQSWSCWTSSGYNGANKGNLALGSYGAGAIDGYIEDDGGNNIAVGHRRWILHADITTMGTGDVPTSGNYPYNLAGEHWGSNCLYVIDGASNRAATDTFVTWPPAGFVPRSQVFDRWSLQFNSSTGGYPRFGNATVTMRMVESGATVPVSYDYRDNGGAVFGDPAIVWVPDWSSLGGALPVEQAIEVTVTGITTGGSAATDTHSYVVTPIDPSVVTDPLEITGPATPPASGSYFNFEPLSGVGADEYQIGVASVETSSWTEGAEDSPSPQLVDGTSGSYQLRTTLDPLYGSPGANSGSKVFHLAFPGFGETTQSFEIDRTVIVGANSQLRFYELFRWATGSSRLSAQLSVDGGPWTEVWGRNGNGSTSTNGWHKQWSLRSFDLSAYAGKTLRVRFVYSGSGSLFIGDGLDDGVFIDDVAITDASQLGSETVTVLGPSASGFTLDETTAGTALSEGDTYFLRVRPVLAHTTFPFGPATAVTIGPAAEGGFADWMVTNYPGIVADGFTDDPDGDGIESGVEYGFGLDPGEPDALPAPERTAGLWQLVFDPGTLSYDTSDITHGATYSIDMVKWEPLTDLDPGEGLRFELPAGERGFFRWTAILNP